MPTLAKRRVFLSFRGEDRQQVDGLRLLAANPNYDLDFYDESVRTPFDSSDAEYVKRRLREKIGRASVTVCLIGELTHTSAWVDWELAESDAKGHTILAMALKGATRTVVPRLIHEKRTAFYSWDPAALSRLIAEA
jgi:hypothetical protein